MCLSFSDHLGYWPVLCDGTSNTIGHCPGPVTCAAHSSGGSGRPGPGRAPDDLPPQRQNLSSGSLYVCWREDFEIDLYRVSLCLFPGENEQGWAYPTLLVERRFPSASPAFFWSFFSFRGFKFVNPLWTFRLLIYWVSKSPQQESKGYYYFCYLNFSLSTV